MSSAGELAFKLQFAISPIIMTGGIASSVVGGILPVLNLTNQLLGRITSSTSLDDCFAYYQPLPNSSLIEQQVATYPFANQSIAANATIQQPLNISMLMICPVGNGSSYGTKLAIISAMQSTFKQHNISGGLYTIMTPFYIYTDCIFLNMTDVSDGRTKQVQNAYKLDFFQPLVSLAAAQQAQNNLMSQITNGATTTGAQSGFNQDVGKQLGSSSNFNGDRMQ